MLCWRAPGGVGRYRAERDLSYLCATAASHCSQGGRARSFTELHGASAQQQRGLEPCRQGEETDSPARSACMHSLRSGAIPEAVPGAETVPTVRLNGPARWACYCRSLLRLPCRAGISSRGFVRHTSWWAVRCSGHSSYCACAIGARAGPY